MANYYITTGTNAKDVDEILKNATINEVRAKAVKILEKLEKPVLVYKVVENGLDIKHVGTVQRWGYNVDRYGVDRSDMYFCWVTPEKVGYILHWNGSLGRRA